MKSILAFCACLLLLVPSLRAQAPLSYPDLLARLKAGDTDVNFHTLRMAYTESEAYNPEQGDVRGLKEQMLQYFYSGEQLARALEMADSVLAECYLDIEAHMVAFLATEALGDSARSCFHEDVVRGLVTSILEGADGQTPTSPYVVISTGEEYALVRVLGFEPGAQRLIECRGNPCNRMEVTEPDTGKSVVLYFDVSKPMSVLNRKTRAEQE